MSWETLFSTVISTLPIIASRRERDHERATLALEALSVAFYSTSAYYDTQFTDPDERRRAQYDLAQKWEHVADLLRPFSTHLWSRFNLKSRFWYEGETWSDEQAKNAKIGLESVRRDARFVLIPKQKKAKR